MTAPKGARRRMVPVAALAAGAVLALSGCGAGQISQTASQVAAVNGNRADVGSIALRNVHIVYPAEGTEYTNAKGGKAVIALSFINNSEYGSDELVGVTTDLGPVEITPATGESTVELGPQQIVVAQSLPGEHDADSATTDSQDADHQDSEAGETTADDPESNPVLIEITDLSEDITPGLTYDISFDFEKNGTVQLSVPVDAGIHTERHESDLSRSSEGGYQGGH
ncbi:hypothetical protein ACL02S_17590 [Nocardia sp. 004]|uniref:hypothetical protein n=1 Tax=Nocardia sp. 004 TaxID=3385978 RepID=UPI0039A12BBB